jgi:cell wall-associated NlpC family hydrolase
MSPYLTHFYRILLLSSFLFISCSGSKKVATNVNSAVEITSYAKSYINTPYRFGGSTTAGMDCSGLIYKSFLRYGKKLPRTTKGLSGYGKKIKLKNVRQGDLLFFKTSKKWGGINHVGIAIRVSGNQIEFIHSTTSSGVIISRMNEKYWSQSYKFARRVL